MEGAPIENNDTISEAAFLLVELHYTLNQLQVQLAELELRSSSFEDGIVARGSARQILEAMLHYESKYQQEYRKVLGSPAPGRPRSRTTTEGDVERVAESTKDEFVLQRENTMAMLKSAGPEWPNNLLDIVRHHVTEDRHHVTRIAELRGGREVDEEG